MSDHHRCSAADCMTGIELNRMFCTKHWQMLTPELRAVLFDLYQPDKPYDEQSETFDMFRMTAIQNIARQERVVPT